MGLMCSGRRRDGKPCGNPAGAGTGHLGTGNCKHHGGSTPNGRKSALEQQGRLELARLNLPPVADPLSQLAAVTAEVLAWKDAWAARVNDLTSVRYQGTGAGEQLRAEIAVWERALDRCERFLVAMARLNIDERLAAISEAQAAAVIEALGVGFDRIGTPPEQRRLALAAVQEHFAA